MVEGRVNQADLFHTFYQALGIDSTASFETNGKEIPMAEPAHGPIEDLLI